MVHPLTDVADPAMVDYDTFVYALKAGYGRRGAKIGSQGDDAARFRADMIEFWSRQLTSKTQRENAR